MFGIRYKAIWYKMIVIGAVFMLMFTSASVAAKQHRARRQYIIVEYEGWLNPTMVDVASHASDYLVSHLSTTASDLQKEKYHKSQNDLSTIQIYIKSIAARIPNAAVLVQIVSPEHDLVHGSASLFFTSQLPRFITVTKYEKNQWVLQKRVPKAAATLLKNHTEIFGAAVYLPLGYVSAMVDTAHNNLQGKSPDVQAAKAAVEDALESLTSVVNERVKFSQS